MTLFTQKENEKRLLEVGVTFHEENGVLVITNIPPLRIHWLKEILESPHEGVLVHCKTGEVSPANGDQIKFCNTGDISQWDKDGIGFKFLRVKGHAFSMNFGIHNAEIFRRLGSADTDTDCD